MPMEFHLPDELREPVTKAVFGGPLPALQALTAMMKANDLPWPVSIAAVQQWQPARLRSSTVKVLQLHEGLTYLLTGQSPDQLEAWMGRHQLVFGGVEVAAGPFQLFHAIQQSILALRNFELQALDQQSQTPDDTRARRQDRPTWQTELQTQRLLVYQLLRHDAHWSRTAELWVRIVMVRNPKHLNEVRRKITQLLGQLCQSVDVNSKLGYAFSNAMDKLYRTHRYADLPAVLMQALHDLRLHLPGDAGSANPQPATIEQALSFMRSHAHEPVSLRDVAEQVGVSAPHLARLFKMTTGQTVTAFLQRQRVLLAMQKLTQSDQNVLEIALDCGFGSVEHFHRVFRRQTGQSPRQYRQTQGR